MKRIVIIGAGPCGLGAGIRLKELKHSNYALYEQYQEPGGLSRSFLDKNGFTWDIGGHVLFSGYDHFNDFIKKILKNDSLRHERKAFIRFNNCWIPYPFQNNLRHLEPKIILECLYGLMDKPAKPNAGNFLSWIRSVFGNGIAKYFMIPYNQKVWAYDLKKMSSDWISERVSVVDFKKVLGNIILSRDDDRWGPNSSFIFPLKGGTGDIFKRISNIISEKIFYNKKAVRIDSKRKIVYFSDSTSDRYDYLINTSPINVLTKSISGIDEKFRLLAGKLRFNSLYLLGLGLRKKITEDKCWIYFPQSDMPVYRLTYFSNYSPNNVVDGKKEVYSSLMCEVSLARNQTDAEKLKAGIIEGLINNGIIVKNDLKNIVSEFVHREKMSYPIPTIERDVILRQLEKKLISMDIYSRGRFGAWRYETGNMDHSFIQGMEAAERIILGKKESILTQK